MNIREYVFTRCDFLNLIGELQVASEIKNDIERVNKEMRKCELVYKKRIDEVFAKREALKVTKKTF